MQIPFEGGLARPNGSNEDFLKPIPNPPKCHFGIFIGVKNTFLERTVD